MKEPSQRGREVECAIEKDGRFRRYRAEHTQYLACYVTQTGACFAAERITQDALRLWFSEDERLKHTLAAKGFEPSLSVPWQQAGTYGRNSNLQRVPEL